MGELCQAFAEGKAQAFFLIAQGAFAVAACNMAGAIRCAATVSADQVGFGVGQACHQHTVV